MRAFLIRYRAAQLVEHNPDYFYTHRFNFFASGQG